MGMFVPEIATGPASNVWIALQVWPFESRTQCWPSPHESVHAGMHAALQPSSNPHDSPDLQPRLEQSGACVIVHVPIWVCPHDVSTVDVSGTNDTATPGTTVLDPGECDAERTTVPCARTVWSASGSVKLTLLAQAKAKASKPLAKSW